MASQDYFRPRGDITTVLDLADRDAQDMTYFPIDASASFFHRGAVDNIGHEKPFTVHPTTLSIQEFPQRGPAHWGQTLTFELGSLHAGDLLQGISLQLSLGSWYDGSILAGLAAGTLTASVNEVPPVGGASTTTVSAVSTAVITRHPDVEQLVPVSTSTLLLWNTVDDSIGVTGLTYSSGLITNSTAAAIKVDVDYSLVLQEQGDGTTYLGVQRNGAFTTYAVVPVFTTPLQNGATITLAPSESVGVYYMDNNGATVLTTSRVSFTVRTTGAITYPLPVAPDTCVPVGASINYSAEYWTYVNSLGTSIIEYADFIVKDQTIERLTGEFIRTHLTAAADVNSLFGLSTDGIGSIPYAHLSASGSTPFAPSRPFPVENGTYLCVLPFFFFRTKLSEVFPLLACNEGQVRIDIKLRPFDQMVRQYVGWRASPTDSPLNQSVSFLTVPYEACRVVAHTASQPPAFRDFRLLTAAAYITGSFREKFLHQPFEQLVKLVQTFSFEEPLKYIVNKSTGDKVDIQLPLELNHPVTELLWVFRRKAVRINNEWSNFSPAVGFELTPDKVFPPWLHHAALRINGSEVISAEGDWFRRQVAMRHKGGIGAYQSHLYGYSFAERPEDHQPTGTANMSRATAVTLRLTVNQPLPMALPMAGWDDTIGGWEVFVFAMHYNWLRFENGICGRMFAD